MIDDDLRLRRRGRQMREDLGQLAEP